MRKAFTLVELQGVIILMAVVVIISIPSVVEQLRKSELKIQTMIETTVFDATRSYVESKPNIYKFTPGNAFCIDVQELFEHGLVSERIFDNNVGSNYDLNGFVIVTVEPDRSLSYEFSSVCNL